MPGDPVHPAYLEALGRSTSEPVTYGSGSTFTDRFGRLIVELSVEDQAAANREGQARRRRAEKKGRKDALGEKGRAMGVGNEEIGASGELAVARWLGVDWEEATIKRPGRRADVGGLNVRTRRQEGDKRLPIRDYDRGPAVLVVASPPRYWLRGWILAAEAKGHPEWLDDPGGYGQPSHFVPADALHPMQELLHHPKVRAAMNLPPEGME